MKGKKFLTLILALLLPSAIFVFLRTFGKNEFNVAPLFANEVKVPAACSPYHYKTPYKVADSVISRLSFGNDSLLCVAVNPSANAFARVKEAYHGNGVGIRPMPEDQSNIFPQCIFLLAEPFDVALVDRKGTIRGQYDMDDREDADRLITELAIILRKY